MNTTTMPTFVQQEQLQQPEAKGRTSRWGRTLGGRQPTNMSRPMPRPSSHRTAQEIAKPRSSALANSEFQLLIHKDYGVIGRIYSPDRKLNTSNSSRTILRENGRTILFVSTLEDYKQLKKICRPSNMACNRIRTAQLLRDLENGVTHQPEVLVPEVEDNPSKPEVITTTQNEEEISSLALVEQTTLALSPASQEEKQEVDTHTTIDVKATTLPSDLPHQEDWDPISLKEELSKLTLKLLRRMLKEVPGKFEGRIKKSRVIKFLAQYPEIVSELLDEIAQS